MAYSLNPKDLREELKTYKQPVYVASTQPAQQSVAPASTSQYRQVKRADGGTDFYNGNQKTTIEEFSKGTGNQVDAVRGNLAAGGSKFDQDVLTKQYFETKDPEVTKFNTLNVDQQRERIAQLKSAAERRNFNVAEDVKNQAWASQQLANVEKFGTKKEGNLLTFGQDFVGGFVAPGKKLVDSVSDSLQQIDRKKRLNALAGVGTGQDKGISQSEYDSALQEIYKNSVDTKYGYNDNGQLERNTLNPLEFAQKFVSEGADAGLTYSPVGAGYKVVVGLGLKDAGATIAKNIFKEGTAYTLANTANDVIQGREVTPGSILINAATSYGGAALGAGGALAKPAIQKAGKAVADSIPTPEKLTMANAEIQALTEKGTELFNRRQALVDQGLSTNSAPYKQLDNAIKALGDEYNTTYQRVLNQSKNELQRGSIQVPGGKAPDDPNRSWNLSNQQDAGYKMFDESKSAAIKKMDEFRAKNNGEPFTAAQQKELEPLMKSMEDGLASAKQASQELSNPISATQSNPLDNSSFFVVGKDGQSSFGKRDLQRTLASAKERADKVGGVVRKGGEVIYDSKAQAPQVGKTEPLTIYRGGKPFDPNLVDSNGASFTTLEKTADYYRGGTKNGVKETYTLAPDTKILNVDKPPSSEMDKFALVSKARNEGYDAIRFGGTENEIRVLNADKVVAPQVTKTPKQPTTQKSAFEADLEAAGLTPYRKQSKAMREAVDQAVYETDPLLFESGSTGAFEAGIPKIKPSSIKEVTGLSARESGIPPRYLSEKDGVALDRLAAEFEGNKGGYGQLTMTSDDMLDVVKKELDTRAASREQKKLLAEMRNDPEIQKRAAIISRTDPESGLYIDEPLALQRENQIAADLEAAGITAPRQAKTKFTRTVKQSMDTPQNVKEAMKGKDGTYTTTSDAQREFAAEKFIKAKGLNSATSDIKERLLDPNFIDNSQNAVDAIKIAEKLAKKGDIQQSVDIYEQLAEKMSKSGQFMQAAAMLARMTPEGVQYRAIKELKKANIELTPERVATLDGYIKEVRSTQDQLGKLKSSKASKADIAVAEEAASIARENVQYYIATQIPEKLASKLVNFWRAGLLTAPTTTGGAVLGNTETLLTRKLWTNPAATMADWVMSAFTGKRTQSFAKTGELAKGAVEGAKALNGQYWKTGRDAMLDGQRMGKYDQPNQKINYGQKPLGRAIGGYVNGVYSLMGAVDKPFRYGAYRESLSSQARAAVDTMRLQNKKINRQEARKLYNDMMENPSTEMKQRATDEALYETFQNKTIAGELIGNMKQWAKREGHSKTAALMDFLMPFTGVPSAIAARVIQRTPIGTANEIVKQIVNVKKNGGKFDQRAMARAIGEGTAGVPVIAAGAALAGAGMVTGGYPRDKKTRNEWEQTGKQPNSVKIGDQWYSLNYLQPFGTLLAIGSAIGEKKLDEGSIQDIIVTGASTAANSIVSMSFLDGISNALSVVTEGASESSVGRFVGNTAASVVPNFIRSGTRAADDVQRDTKGDNVIDTAIKSVAGALPGTRQLLPAKTDQFGQPLPAKNNFVNQFLNPLRPSQSIGQDDPSVQELSRLLSIDSGVKPTEATKATFKDHELKYSEIKELNQLAGPKMKEEYDKLVQSPEYAALSDEDKVKALKKVNDTVFGAVKAQWGYDKGYVTEEQLKDLNSNQRRYAQGNGANYITGGIGDTKLDSKSTAYKFLDSKPEMTDDEKATWSRSEASQEYQPMIDQLNAKLPEGLPKVPYTNKTAELISEFEKARADSNWSKLELNDKTKDLAINTYKAQLTDNEQFITTLSDDDIKTAAQNGQISKEELDRIVAIDDITTKLGGSQMIGNKTRKLLGYGTIASKSGGGKSSSAKKSYKLNAFGDVSGEVSGNLRKLIEQATIKGV